MFDLMNIKTLSDNDLLEHYKKTTKLADSLGFNSKNLRQQKEMETCRIKAELIRRKIEV